MSDDRFSDEPVRPEICITCIRCGNTSFTLRPFRKEASCSVCDYVMTRVIVDIDYQGMDLLGMNTEGEA